MASSSVSPSLPAQPIGRVREIHEIEQFIDLASVGVAGLVLTGEAGIGKTQLWRHGVRLAEARGLLTLVARQRQSDATTPLGGLADLLGEVPNAGFAVLPALQRDAIDIALLRAAPPATPGRGSSTTAMDERVLAAGVLSLIRSLARDSPVIVAIDDLQWLDAATARLLEFAARRLVRDRVGFLATERLAKAGSAGAAPPAVPLGGALDPDRLVTLQVGPLSVAALHEVIRIRAGATLPRPTLLRVHDVSRGNPFHAIQLATAFLATGRGRLAGDPLPVPHDLDVLLGHRLDGLTNQTQAVLLALSCLPRPTLADLARIVDAGAELDARVDAAIRAGLVEFDDWTIRFTHPLLATVVETRATTESRRAVHRRIASTTDDPELRAFHLALAAERPDPSIASELERAAVSASARGDRDRALVLLELVLAATPSDDAASRYQRTLALADAAFGAGDGPRATTLLDGLRRSLGPGRERAEILFRLGTVAQTEDIDRSVDLLRAAASEAGDDIALRARIQTELARFPSWLRLGIDEVERIAREAIDLAERVGDQATQAHALGVLGGILVRSGRGIPHDLMHRAMALEAAAGPIRVDEDGGPAIVYAEMLADGDDLDVARVHVERLVDGARQAGDLAVSYALFVLAYVEYDAGRWERAQEAAAESLDLSVTTGREATEVLAAAALALVRSGRGDVEEAGRLGEHGLDLANRIGRGGRAPRAALGLLELAREDAAAAWGWLEPAVGRIVPLGLDQPSPPVTDAAEALAALGRFDEADRLAALTESNARRLGPRWTIAMALRARASVAAGRGDDRAAEAFLDEALTVGSSGRPLEKGRTLLMLGSVCRRLRKKRKAAEALGLALSIFERLPAPIWADRTRHEMARIGGRPMAVGGAVGASLSATEDGIVRLVRRGRTNREIAEELALSPKTVEWNLTRIYRKLGVRSRTELAARGAPRGT